MTHKRTSNSRWEGWMRRFYGVQDLDEYRLAELNQIGNRAYLMLTAYLAIANVVAYFIWFYQPEWAFWGMLAGNLLVLMGLSAYVALKVRRLKLDAVEVAPDKVTATRRHLRWASVKAGALFAVWMHIAMAVISAVLGEDGWAHLTGWRFILTNLISGLFFGGIMYWVSQRRLMDGLAPDDPNDLETEEEVK